MRCVVVTHSRSSESSEEEEKQSSEEGQAEETLAGVGEVTEFEWNLDDGEEEKERYGEEVDKQEEEEEEQEADVAAFKARTSHSSRSSS